MRRVLKPSGALAAWGYDLCCFPDNQEANKVLEHLYEGVLGPYWSERRRLIESQYEGDLRSASFPEILMLGMFEHAKDLQLVTDMGLAIDGTDGLNMRSKRCCSDRFSCPPDPSTR